MSKKLVFSLLIISNYCFAQTDLENGKEYARLGDYGYALTFLNRFIFDNPDDAQGYMERAKVYQQTNKMSEAYRDLDSAMVKNKNDEKIVLLKIDFQKQNKEYDKAIAEIYKLMENKPAATELYAQLTVIKLLKGDKIGAMKDRIKQFNLDEIQVFIETNKGVEVYLQNNFTEACEIWGNIRGNAKTQAEYFVNVFCQ